MRTKKPVAVDTTKESKLSQKPVRLKQSTFEKLTEILSKTNQKEGGKRVKADDVLGLALSLLNESHINQLRERSQSNADRLDRAHRDYIASKGAIGKDAFLGLVIEGKWNIFKTANKQS